MKKQTKIAAALAALVLALALAGCDNEESAEEGSNADWTGFTMVDSADKLDFKVGTYEMKRVGSREYKEKTLFVETDMYVVEILPAENVSITRKSTIEKINDDAYYAHEKEDWKEYCKEKGYTCTFNDSTRTITVTYPDEPDFQSLSDFKKDWISPEEDSEKITYSDIKFGSNKNGIIQASYSMHHTWSESDGTVGSNTTHITTTLTPQK